MNDTNDQLILIAGQSATGKSASLRNLRNQEKWMYLNTEAGKRLPFKNHFKTYRIEDPLQVLEAFDYATTNPEIEGVIVDSLTFLMDMYETQYVLTSTNTMKAWSDYNQFFKSLLQDKVIKIGKPVIFIAHTLKMLNEATGEYESSVPIKGALKGQGVEAYFSCVVAAKKVPLKQLKEFKSDLLHIEPEEDALGYKYVFQTRLTKDTVGERIRSPMGLFKPNETWMDNDAQILLDHLINFYKD